MTPTSAPGAPAGYEQSCALILPWGRVSAFPYACIDEPWPDRAVSGAVVVRGYAAGSPDQTVTVELRSAAGSVLASERVSYDASGAGMPGQWQTTLTVPAGAAAGPAILAVYFSDAAGTVAAEGIVNVEIPPPAAGP